MINVTLNRDGTALIGFPGKSVTIAEPTLATARQSIITILTNRATYQAAPLDVTVLDDGTPVRLEVHPNGHVIRRTEATLPPIVEPPAAEPTVAMELSTGPVRVDTLPGVVEQTRITRRRLTAGAHLAFSTGDAATITGTALIGRLPATNPDQTVDQLIAIHDPDRSVSQTHLHAQWTGGQLLVTDQGSGNGTVLHRTGTPPLELLPHVAHPITDGDRLVIGDHDVHVSITTSI